jgi:hypothetical protein
MANEVTTPTRKDKMASGTATGLGMGDSSDQRESWIPYPTLPDSGDTANGYKLSCRGGRHAVGASVALLEKSVKLPNPPVLTDGKDPEFEDWDSRMRNKLKANADPYNTEALRIAYVENRVGGKAAKHLRPRLRPG